MSKLECYAAINRDDKTRLESSSGGVFSCFAEKYDVVYGVAMSSDCYSAKMIRTENDISTLRGSKYIQADMGETLISIKKDLLDGRKVLFTGTGCQVNGLKSFLRKEYNTLTCIDVVCHGVPSPKLWKEYIVNLEQKKGKLQSVNFRYKQYDQTRLDPDTNRFWISKDKDPYMQMFLNNSCLRPSCYECYAKKNKQSDITIADFWGIEKIAPELNDGNGASLIIIRTDVGHRLFEGIKDSLIWKRVSYEEAVQE